LNENIGRRCPLEVIVVEGGVEGFCLSTALDTPGLPDAFHFAGA